MATQQNETTADSEDWDALETAGPKGQLLLTSAIREEPEIHIFKYWLHFLNILYGQNKTGVLTNFCP